MNRRSIPALLSAFGLAACGSTQRAVDRAEYVCKDGVEYFVYERMDTGGRVAWNVVPHFKPDGSLYGCAAAPAAASPSVPFEQGDRK